MTISWPTLAAVCAALAGLAGTILTPLYGHGLAAGVQAVLQAVSGLLLAIPTGGATAIVHATAKDKLARARLVQR